MLKRTYILSFILSVAVATVICNIKGDSWEEYLRQLYYQNVIHQRIPSTYYVHVDNKGAPYVEYVDTTGKTIANKYMPTTVAIYALRYYDTIKSTGDKKAVERFLNCLECLQDSLTDRGNFALYEFSYAQPYYSTVGVLWRSGLSSGKAIEAFTKAYKWSGEEKYLNLALQLMRGFYVPIQAGGFTYMNDGDWWYEEYADTNLLTPRVINGHVYAMLGCYELWLATKNDSAKMVFEKGLNALKKNIHLYDAGHGWTYYDAFGKKSDKQYQRTMVDLMAQLYNITGDKLFEEYRTKWSKPLNTLYLRRIIHEKNKSGILLFLSLTAILYLTIQSSVAFLQHINRQAST
ncbi:MAG: hypothetical protein KIS94_14840 [Chitinophagales bacterium]|nr:hypothetical protein [Chitinophagales bacterium]